MGIILPIIVGSSDIPHAENLPFKNSKNLTDGSVTRPQPDSCDGSLPQELAKEVRAELGEYIVPSTNRTQPCLPNFFLKGKGLAGSYLVAKRQVLYDSALGARGIHELRSFCDPETALDNNAYTFSATYQSPASDLTLYATWPTPSTDPMIHVKYRME